METSEASDSGLPGPFSVLLGFIAQSCNKNEEERMPQDWSMMSIWQGCWKHVLDIGTCQPFAALWNWRPKQDKGDESLPRIAGEVEGATSPTQSLSKYLVGGVQCFKQRSPQEWAGERFPLVIPTRFSYRQMSARKMAALPHNDIVLEVLPLGSLCAVCGLPTAVHPGSNS